MADVYGRLTTYPGVCLATLGPGATNLITGIADANLDRAPLVAITGQAGLERVYKESHQYIDVVQMLKPITKWNARVEQVEAVPEMVRKAFRLARLEKPGATHLELPEDIASMDVPANIQPMPIRRTTYPQAGPIVLEKAADLLCAAKRPLVLVGNGVVRRQAGARTTVQMGGAASRRVRPGAVAWRVCSASTRPLVGPCVQRTSSAWISRPGIESARTSVDRSRLSLRW